MNARPRHSPKVWMVRPKMCTSGCKALRAYLEVVKRIHNGAVDARLEVQVRAEAAARAARVPDHLALGYVRAHRGREARLVRVTGRERAGVLDAGEVAVAAARRLGLHQHDRPGRGGADRRAARPPDVDPGMAGPPRARLAEGRGDRAVDGPDDPPRAGADRPRHGDAGDRGQPRLDALLRLAQRGDVVLELVPARARGRKQRELLRARGLDALAAVDQRHPHRGHLVAL